jgi:hypothetical protein
MFAERFVLPKRRFDPGPSDGHWANVDKFGFEASRRIFKIEGSDAPSSQLVCHVLAQTEYQTTERLLADFVERFHHGDDSESVHCDSKSDLCLWTSPSWRLIGRRSYCEVVIAWPGALPKAFPKSGDGGRATALQPSGGREIEPMAALKHTNGGKADASQESVPVHSPNAAFDEALYKRSEADWTFVSAQIEAARKDGRDLDQKFTEEVARRRLRQAGTYAYSDRPDAGPTFESSLGIVRTILSLHLAATSGADDCSGNSERR